ncbi:antibiotic biosynthesis monooxygenase [Streptomyces sp. TS71-3]|uniref:antibiotic biosynthesis monooxygenase n=1 Tax=Streptomyces sp. TS71-3 TaxID=2733862 RepID=UPI001BB349C5|nr:antibiotic biosynthesis monooxygenase [Streptomyces sp. TS71-3]
MRAIAAAWGTRRWPGPGLRSYGVLACDDGETLLHLCQVDEGADEGAVAEQDPAWEREVDEAVPGIERAGVVAARLRRSTPVYGAVGDAGCAVLVTREFDGPDVDRAQGLVEAMFEGGSRTPPAAGMVSAHFYVSTDGSRVFNYALWTSAQAHQDAIESRPPELEDDARWKQAHAWPGLLSTTFQRFRPRLHLVPG